MAVPTSISEKYSKTGTEVDAARFLIELSGKQFSAREKSGQPVEPFCVQQERDLGGLEEGDRAGLQIKTTHHPHPISLAIIKDDAT